MLNDRKNKWKADVFMERMTWKEIQEKYPDQWVGLIDVKYVENDGISIESAVIKYLDKPKGELTRMALRGEIVSRYTTPDNAVP